jgi:hypothetical protein
VSCSEEEIVADPEVAPVVELLKSPLRGKGANAERAPSDQRWSMVCWSAIAYVKSRSVAVAIRG